MSLATPLRIEQAEPTYTYSCLHIPTGQIVKRTIEAGEATLFGQLIWTRAQLLEAINRWNAEGANTPRQGLWKYWMD